MGARKTSRNLRRAIHRFSKVSLGLLSIEEALPGRVQEGTQRVLEVSGRVEGALQDPDFTLGGVRETGFQNLREPDREPQDLLVIAEYYFDKNHLGASSCRDSRSNLPPFSLWAKNIVFMFRTLWASLSSTSRSKMPVRVSDYSTERFSFILLSFLQFRRCLMMYSDLGALELVLSAEWAPVTR